MVVALPCLACRGVALQVGGEDGPLALGLSESVSQETDRPQREPKPTLSGPQKNELRARPARKTKEWVEGQATLQSAVVGQAIPTQFRSCTGGADGADGAGGAGGAKAAWACELCRNSGRSRRRTLGGDEENPSWAKEGGVEFSSGFKGNGNRP